jgi:hypothetical protein
MIIKITVSDNDFGEIIEHYLDNFFRFKLTDTISVDKTNKESLMKYFDLSQMDDNMFQLIRSEKLSIENKEKLENYIKTLFELSIKNHKSKDYLMKNLEIKVLYNLKCMDENGECYYYFPTNYKYINQ